MTLEVDRYGNVLKSVSIGYGRKQSPLPEQTDRDKQMGTLITYTENSATKAVDDDVRLDDYRTPLAAEARTYELNAKPRTGGYAPSGSNGFFQFTDFVRPVAGQLQLTSSGVGEVFYEEPLTQDKTRRLIEHVRTLYRKDDLTDLLAPGDLEPLALPGESYKLAFTPGLISDVFKRKIGAAPEENLLAVPDRMQVLGGKVPDGGGYVDLDNNGCWWMPSGRIFFDPAADASNPARTAAAEQTEARGHFYLPRKFTNPFDMSSLVDYDRVHDLFVAKTQDALLNTITAIHDYRALQPFEVTDANGNRSQARFDALGMVVGTAVMGKASAGSHRRRFFYDI